MIKPPHFTESCHPVLRCSESCCFKNMIEIISVFVLEQAVNQSSWSSVGKGGCNAFCMWFNPADTASVWHGAFGPDWENSQSRREGKTQWLTAKEDRVPEAARNFCSRLNSDFMCRQPPCQNLSLKKERGERKQAFDFTTQQAASEGTERQEQDRGGVERRCLVLNRDRGGRWVVGETAVLNPTVILHGFHSTWTSWFYVNKCSQTCLE